MTLALRSTYIFISIILTVLILLAAGGLFFLLIQQNWLGENIHRITHGWNWWFPEEGANLSLQGFQTAVISLSLTLFSLLSLISLRTYFRKTASPEIFFFSLFIFTLAFQSLRILNLYLYSNYMPLLWQGYITRILFMSRLGGIFFLVSASLYAAGFKYQEYGIMVLVNIILSFVITMNLPINNFRLNSALFSTPGELIYWMILFVVLEILALVNLTIAFFLKGQRDYLFLILSMAAILIGVELLFFPLNIWLTLGGFLLLIGGTVQFSSRFHHLYLWI